MTCWEDVALSEHSTIHIKRMQCDECGCITDVAFVFGGDELCEECYRDAVHSAIDDMPVHEIAYLMNDEVRIDG